MKKQPMFPHELVGERIEVVGSKNHSNLGIQGQIVDETKATIKVKENKTIRTLMKANLKIKLIKNGQIIKGSQLTKRPHERLK